MYFHSTFLFKSECCIDFRNSMNKVKNSVPKVSPTIPSDATNFPSAIATHFRVFIVQSPLDCSRVSNQHMPPTWSPLTMTQSISTVITLSSVAIRFEIYTSPPPPNFTIRTSQEQNCQFPDPTSSVVFTVATSYSRDVDFNCLNKLSVHVFFLGGKDYDFLIVTLFIWGATGRR